MSPFEFFFSFYGLLLGFSVAEVVGGFARMIHERRNVRFGVLTPMLAAFVAFDIATFWNQAWLIFRNAPFNFSLLILGLLVASVFYVAATLVFPRRLEKGADLDSHFWEHKRMVLLCVLAANMTMFGAFMLISTLNGEFAQLGLGGRFWIGMAIFTTGTLVAAFARSRRVVLVSLSILLVYIGFNVGRSAVALFDGPGWSLIATAPMAKE